MLRNIIDLSSILDTVLASFWEHFLINVHTFSTSNFASILEHMFDGKWLPKWMSATSGGAPFFPYFRALASILFAFCPKAVFRMHFGRHLAPFWIPLATFWFPLPIFWFPFGTIWPTFAHPGAQFSHFGIPQRHFSYSRTNKQCFGSECINLATISNVFDVDFCIEFRTYLLFKMAPKKLCHFY